MPAWLGALGMQAAGNAINSGMGMALGAYNDKRQIRQQEKLNELENKRAMEMWEKTNYKAQVDQLKKAGLNPGLLYGMSGGGATTTGHGGASAPTGGGELGMMKQSATELALLKAQKENIEADTELKKATKPKTEAETSGITLTNEFLKKTMNDRIDIINTEAGQKIEELIQAQGNTQVNRQTIMARTDIVMREAAQKLIENALLEEQIKKTGQDIEQSKATVTQMKAQIEKWAQEIAQGWAGLDNQAQDIRIKAFVAEFNANHPGIGQVLGGAIQRLADSISKPLQGNKIK